MTIKDNLKISVALVVRPVEPTWCRITLNADELYYGILDSTKLIISNVGIDDPIQLKIEVERTHPQAIIVDKLGINAFSILPQFQHLCNPPTTYIDFTGEWELKIEPSFYPWLHTASGQGWIVG